MVATHIKTETDIQSLPLRRYADAANTNRSRISWGSVFAGSLFGLMFQFWLALLGVAIGASTVDPLKDAHPLRGLGLGTGIWLGVSIIIASFVGGWIAGRFAGWRSRVDSGVHGAVSWALSNFAIYAIIGMIAGGIAGSTAQVAGGAASGAGRAVSAAGPIGLMGAAHTTRSTLDQARNTVQSGQAEQQARQAGDMTAKAVAGSSFGLVAAMFLGLLAGIGGALVGAPRLRS